MADKLHWGVPGGPLLRAAAARWLWFSPATLAPAAAHANQLLREFALSSGAGAAAAAAALLQLLPQEVQTALEQVSHVSGRALEDVFIYHTFPSSNANHFASLNPSVHYFFWTAGEYSDPICEPRGCLRLWRATVVSWRRPCWSCVLGLHILEPTGVSVWGTFVDQLCKASLWNLHGVCLGLYGAVQPRPTVRPFITHGMFLSGARLYRDWAGLHQELFEGRPLALSAEERTLLRDRGTAALEALLGAVTDQLLLYIAPDSLPEPVRSYPPLGQ